MEIRICLKYPILGQFLRKFGQKLIFHKDQPYSFLGSVVSKLHAKNQKKLMSQFWEKLSTNRRINEQTYISEKITH